MKLSFEEKNVIETLSALSAKDFKNVQEIFKALLLSSVLNLYDSKDKEFEILIPYIAKLKVNFDIVTSDNALIAIKIDVEPQASLKEEICNFVNGESGSVEKMLKKNIAEGIMKKLDIESIEIEL